MHLLDNFHQPFYVAVTPSVKRFSGRRPENRFTGSDPAVKNWGSGVSLSRGDKDTHMTHVFHSVASMAAHQRAPCALTAQMHAHVRVLEQVHDDATQLVEALQQLCSLVLHAPVEALLDGPLLPALWAHAVRFEGGSRHSWMIQRLALKVLRMTVDAARLQSGAEYVNDSTIANHMMGTADPAQSIPTALGTLQRMLVAEQAQEFNVEMWADLFCVLSVLVSLPQFLERAPNELPQTLAAWADRQLEHVKITTTAIGETTSNTTKTRVRAVSYATDVAYCLLLRRPESVNKLLLELPGRMMDVAAIKSDLDGGILRCASSVARYVLHTLGLRL